MEYISISKVFSLMIFGNVSLIYPIFNTLVDRSRNLIIAGVVSLLEKTENLISIPYRKSHLVFELSAINLLFSSVTTKIENE